MQQITLNSTDCLDYLVISFIMWSFAYRGLSSAYRRSSTLSIAYPLHHLSNIRILLLSLRALVFLSGPTQASAAAVSQPPQLPQSPYTELGNDYVVLKLTGAGTYPVVEFLVIDFHPSYEAFGRRTDFPNFEDDDDSSSTSTSSSSLPSPSNDVREDASETRDAWEASQDSLMLPDNSYDKNADDNNDSAATSGNTPNFQSTAAYHHGIAYMTPHLPAVRSVRILHSAADVTCYILEAATFDEVKSLPIRPGRPLELGKWQFMGVGGVTCVMPR